MNKQRRLLMLAEQELGIREISGKLENPRIRKYHRYSTLKNDKGMSETVPWCSSAMCYVVEMAGLKSTNSKMARSWERGGYKNSSRHPLPGDIVTFYRNGKKSGQGHVAMLLRATRNYVTVMGGNQSDAFNIKRYSTLRMTGIWRVHDESISQAQVDELHKIAGEIIAENKITSGGKVT